MKKIAKIVMYLALTFIVIRLIPFSQLSDFVAEKIPSSWVGEGEDAYNNVDMIAIIIHIAISIAIVYTLSTIAKFFIKRKKSTS